MKRLIPLLALCLVLMGQDDCENETPPPEPPPEPPAPISEWCHGNDYSIMNNVSYGYETGGLTGGLSAILMGDPSDDMRSTVYVGFGQSYCTGVVLSPTVVLTAGHCGYGENTVHTIRRYERDVEIDIASSREELALAWASSETGKLVKPNSPGSFSFYPANEASAGLVRTEEVVEVSHTVHPDYLEYTQTDNLEKRKADLMIIKLASPLTTVTPVRAFYNPKYAKFCNGCVAQGFGRHEGNFRDIRETKYIITSSADPKYLTSKASDLPEGEQSGRICFGDSGGPLYCDIGGVPELCGITTTTMSSDCLAGGNHVNVTYQPFREWIAITGGV